MILKNLSGLQSIAEGGEGIIYEYNGKIIKIYKPSINLFSKRNKIKILLSKNLPSSIIGPIEEVVDRNNKFIGFMMEKVSGEDFKKLANKKFISSNNITSKEILEMLIKIYNILIMLHAEDIYVGDLNDQNILFDNNFNIYFIDCDSWTIGSEKCEVAMDSFKDPLLKGNDFNEETDMYSFAIIAWKALTRIHPFGGTMNPDIDMLERMTKGISIIDNPKVKIPRTIRSWKNLSPELISIFKNIFENKTRKFNNELEDMLSNLKFCKVDKDYYYGKYQSCPLCDGNAKIITKPISQGVINGLKLIAILSADNINTVLNETTYINKNNKVIDIRSGNSTTFIPGKKYYFTESGILIIDDFSKFIIYGKDEYVFEKKFKTDIIVQDNRIYYINKQSALTEVTTHSLGNSTKKKCQCGNNAYFNIVKDNFCVVNAYDNNLVINCNGYNCNVKYSGNIVNYGIHYDCNTNSWLIVLENKSGIFRTLVLNNGKVIYDNDKIKYQCHLNNLCLSNETIFIPIDGKIRGYAFKRDIYKDFECNIADNDSKLIRSGKKFVIINDENIYHFG